MNRILPQLRLKPNTVGFIHFHFSVLSLIFFPLRIQFMHNTRVFACPNLIL